LGPEAGIRNVEGDLGGALFADQAFARLEPGNAGEVIGVPEYLDQANRRWRLEEGESYEVSPAWAPDGGVKSTAVRADGFVVIQGAGISGGDAALPSARPAGRAHQEGRLKAEAKIAGRSGSRFWPKLDMRTFKF
jgi:hypothetical protein